MTLYRQQLRSVLDAVQVTTPSSYSWLGITEKVLPGAMARQMSDHTTRQWMLASLQRRLYRTFYCYGTVLARAPHGVHSPIDGKTPFVEELSAANSGKGSWQSGWKVSGPGATAPVAERGGLTVSVEQHDIQYAPSNCGDSSAKVWMPKEMPRASPGFYLAVGDTDAVTDTERHIWRFYWRLTPDGAVEFMRVATSVLNAAGCPFQLKVIANRENFSRHDAVVLYLPAQDPSMILAVLPRLLHSCECNLLPGGPALTLPLAHGLSWAEEPGTGESFGWHRCRIIAEGMLRGYERGARSPEERLRIVEGRFLQDDISPEAPYLRSSSSKPPAFPALDRGRAPAVRSSAPLPAMSYLECAREIGRQICEDAIWHGARCTWVGAEPADIREVETSSQEVVYRTLGPDVYDGTAGIALFLAELYAATGDDQARRTSVAAIRQALHRLDTIPPVHALGFYTGRLGVAYAAARVGSLTATPGLEECGVAAAGRVMRTFDGHATHDLVGGRAGGIVALVLMGGDYGDERLIAFASRLGDELLEAAAHDQPGWSWPSDSSRTGRNLTGLAHGTAGISLAFLALFQATGDARYRDGAEHGFQYEASCFNAELGNWPDFRTWPGTRGTRAGFMAAWCHGAPGIALARAHAWDLLGGESYARDLSIALETTSTRVRRCLDSGSGDFSLCHGITGNAGIVADVVRRCAPSNAVTYAHLTTIVADYGVRMCRGVDGRWRAGADAGKTPGLMLGLSGIGHFYLRLHNPLVRSVLLPAPTWIISSPSPPPGGPDGHVA